MSQTKVHPVNSTERRLEIETLGIKKCRCNQINLNKDKICLCGSTVEAHEQSVIDRFSSQSSSLKIAEAGPSGGSCVDDGQTNAFGELWFQGSNESVAKYVRVSHRTDQNIMWKLLFSQEYWNMRRPELIISVTGSATLDSLKHSLRDTFCKGLVKVARTTKALVTTGGTYNGCMKLVGEAFKENSLSVDSNRIADVLGIATWGSIQNNEKLIIKDNETNNKTHVVEYELTKKARTPGDKSPKTAPLDPNHTHFVLVDTATCAFGDEVPFRADLETMISQRLKIPIAVLVVGGGFRTAASVAEAVDNQTPCVFFESSGEVADIFSFAWNRIEKTKEKNKDNPDFKLENFLNDIQFREEIISKVEKYTRDEKKKVSIIKSIESTVLVESNHHLLTVCRPVNGVAEIDVAILRALLKKEKAAGNDDVNAYQSQLRLALKWNRIDIARSFIFTDEHRDKIGSLDEFFLDALANNKVEFIKLFLENGFLLKNFVTNRVLIKLYNEVPKTSPLNRFILSKTNERRAFYTFKMIGQAIESLLDDFYSHRFSKSLLGKLSFSNVEEILRTTLPNGKKSVNANSVFKIEDDGKTETIDIDEKVLHPEHELFMFSALTGWHEMTKLFCTEGRNSICSALVASKIFKDYAEFYEDEATSFNEMANDFEIYACDILQRCYEIDREKAERTLKRPIPEYDDCTSIQAALLADDLSFIAHPCFQNVLTKVWYSKIEPDVSWISLIFFTLLPFLSPLLFYSRSKKKKEQRELNKKLEETNLFSRAPPNTLEVGMQDSRTQLAETTESIYSADFNAGLLIINHIRKVFVDIFEFVDAPLIKFTYHQTFYLLFLTLFSFVILCDFYMVNEGDPATTLGLAISIPEIILIVWIASFAADLIRKYFNNDQKLLKARLRNFFSDYWNQIDLISIAIYIVGLVLRFIPNENCFIAARIIMCIDILFWFSKSLYTYLFWKDLGPKITMIKNMLFQLLYFLLIVVLFVFAYGVSSQAILFQDMELNVQLLKNIFFPSFFVIAGEYLDRPVLMAAALSKCSDDNAYPYDSCPDQVGANIVLVLFVLYLIFMNILLINLLIAIFNNTYDEIETASNKIWRYQRYGLVFDYYYKPLLVPPLSIIYYAFLLVKFILKSIKDLIIKKKVEKDNLKSFLKHPIFVEDIQNHMDEVRLINWEKFITNQLITMQDNEKKQKFDSKIDENYQKLDSISSKFDSFIGYETENLIDRMESLDKNLKNVFDIVIRNARKV